MSTKNRGLGGKGIGALFPEGEMNKFEGSINEKGELLTDLDIKRIIPNQDQPRRKFDAETISLLAESIKEVGLLQPITVRKRGAEYELIAGERRLRACQSLGHKKIRAIIVDADEKMGAELALIENLQREDLNPVDEALAYKMLVEKHDVTHEALSTLVGKSRAHITNMIRLLTLNERELVALTNGRISVGHAKVLLSIKNPAIRNKVFKLCVEQGISVREAEKLANSSSTLPTRKEKTKKIDPELTSLEKRLGDALGTKVCLKQSSSGNRGSITIDFYSKEERERIVELLFHVEQ